MRSPACRRRRRRGRAGWCSATPMAGRCRRRSARSPRAVVAAGIPGERLGIHTHDDTGNAVANSLAAIDAGARQVQGTLNGLGERCGNANLVTLIPTLLLKEPYASRFEIGVARGELASLTRVSRLLDDILNRVPDRAAPYVGASAFTHKAGLHASAILKDPTTYEHVAPEVVGNARFIPMSNQAGQSNLRERLAKAGHRGGAGRPAAGGDPDRGEGARGPRASPMTARRRASRSWRGEILGLMPRFFEVERYRVTVERRHERPRRDGDGVGGGGGGALRAGAGDERQREPRSGDARRPGPGERAEPGAAQGPRAVPGLYRRHAAGRFPRPHHLGRHRGGHAGADRERGRAGAALVRPSASRRTSSTRASRRCRTRSPGSCCATARRWRARRRWTRCSSTSTAVSTMRGRAARADTRRALALTGLRRAAAGARHRLRAGGGEPGAARGAAGGDRHGDRPASRRSSPPPCGGSRRRGRGAGFAPSRRTWRALPFPAGELRPALVRGRGLHHRRAGGARGLAAAARGRAGGWRFTEAVWLTGEPSSRARAHLPGLSGDDRRRRRAAADRRCRAGGRSATSWSRKAAWARLLRAARGPGGGAGGGAGRRAAAGGDARGDRGLAGARADYGYALLRRGAMTDEAVAELVRRGDPERWRTAMAARAGGPAGADGALCLQPRDRPGAVGGVGADAGRDPPALVAGRDRRDLRRAAAARRTRWPSRWPRTIRGRGPAAAALRGDDRGAAGGLGAGAARRPDGARALHRPHRRAT